MYHNGHLAISSVYLSSPLVGHLSDTPRRRLVKTRDSARIQMKLLRAPPGSLKSLAYSAVSRYLSLMSYPKDY